LRDKEQQAKATISTKKGIMQDECETKITSETGRFSKLLRISNPARRMHDKHHKKAKATTHGG